MNVLFDERWRADRKYKKIWNKVSKNIKKGFDSESVYGEKYLKTRTKSYEGKISLICHDGGIRKEGSH